MRGKQALRGLCIAAAMLCVGRLVSGHVVAQEIDDIDFNTLPSASTSTAWSSLYDPRVTQKRPLDFLTGGMPDRMIYYAGLDASHWSVGGFGGAQWVPAGLNQDGFILRMFLSESLERYVASRRSYDTQIGRASLMPGYMFRTGNLEVQLLAGFDFEADFFFVDQRPNKWRIRSGMRATADTWWEPTSLVMLQSSLSGTTIDNGYTMRVATGLRLFDWFWVGPEAILSNDYFSQQTRLGAHVTGLRTGPYEWSFAAGHVQDNFQREGFYSRFGIMLRPPRQPFFEN